MVGRMITDRNDVLLKDAAMDLYLACKAAAIIFRNFNLEHLIVFDILEEAINKAEGWKSDEDSNCLDQV